MLADFQLIHYRERNTSINADALFSFLREQGIPDEIVNYAQQQVRILDILLYTPDLPIYYLSQTQLRQSPLKFSQLKIGVWDVDLIYKFSSTKASTRE